MLGGAIGQLSIRCPQHNGHSGLTAEHEPRLCHLVEHLIHCDAEEIRIVHIHHRTGACQRCAPTAADDERLRDRRVDHTVGKLAGQILELAENTALPRNILSHDKHSGIFFHCHSHCLQGCLCKSYRTHKFSLLSVRIEIFLVIGGIRVGALQCKALCVRNLLYARRVCFIQLRLGKV